MSEQADKPVPGLRAAVAEALEDARVEVARRMAQQSIPVSETIVEFQIVDHGAGGTRSELATVQSNTFRDYRVQLQIADNSIPSRGLGLRPQLEPLAIRLDRTTDLGTRAANLLPQASGVEAILVRYVTSLAYQYLGNLPDVSRADPVLVERLTSELEELINPDVVWNTSQLAIEGVRVQAPLEYRGVTLRPLSPSERGRYWQSRNDVRLNPNTAMGGFFVPFRFTMMIPATLLEVTTSRPRTEMVSQSMLLNRVTLAFYLLGYELAGTGVAVTFDHPTWAITGQSHQRHLVDERTVTGSRQVSAEDFRTIVDLAHQMSDFGPGESSSQEIALYRVLRGLGMHWQETGFLDFVIALEATLLQGVESELSYRFALYGSLFLEGSHDPRQTFDQLKNIYEVRSKLVHGSKIPPAKRQRALEDAPELAKAIILRAIQHGWPEKRRLDDMALKMKE